MGETFGYFQLICYIFLFLHSSKDTEAVRVHGGDTKTLMVGVLAPDSLVGDKSKRLFITGVCELAKKDMNPILKEHGYKLDFDIRGSGCNAMLSIGSAAYLVSNNVTALIGPTCSAGCIPVGLLAAHRNLPMISFGCSSGDLSKKDVYPTFARTRPFARTVPRYLKGIVMGVLERFDWDHIGIVYSTGLAWAETFTAIRDMIRASNKTTIFPVVPVETYATKEEIIPVIKESCRVVLFLCYQSTTTELLTHAFEAGMNSGEYAFITIDYKFGNYSNTDWFVGSHVIQGLLNIGVKPPSEKFGPLDFVKFETEVLRAMRNHLGVGTKDLKFYDSSAYAYDAIKLYFGAILKIIEDQQQERRTHFLNVTKMADFLDLNDLTLTQLDEIHVNMTVDVNSTWHRHNFTFPTNWTTTINKTLPIMNYTYETDFDPDLYIRNGTLIMKKMFNSKTDGKSGRIYLNEDGDRYPVLIFDNVRIREDQVSFTRTYEYNVVYDRFTTKDSEIIWPGGGKTAPLAIPVCGFEDELCEESSLSTNDVILMIVAPMGVAAGLYILWKLYKKQQYEHDLLDKRSMFKHSELEVAQLIAREKERQTELKRSELHRTESMKKAAVTMSDEHNDEETRSEENLNSSPSPVPVKSPQMSAMNTRRRLRQQLVPDIYEDVGHMNDATGNRYFFAKLRTENVFVKKIPKSFVDASRDVLVEMKEVRDLVHPNLNTYVGFCLGPPYVLIASMSQKKGTLQDILTNEDIQLDWVFRNTFASDILSGLCAIHESPIAVHGRLTSRNILVDNRWNCKITDFGLYKFKDISQEVQKPELDDDAKYAALLWTAPENINFPNVRRTKEGDVYSFGIILSEIINRHPPFSTFSQYSARDHIHFVHKRCIPPFRPHVRLQAGLDGRTLDMMRSCWDEFPENRPTIHQVRATFKNIIKDLAESNNLLDNMIEMMEKYAHELELTVQEKTYELEVEKKKCDTLFYRSLPPKIGEKLKTGQEIETGATTAASVLAFKVDNFTQFVEELEAQQAVDLLHDVHKVVEISISDEQEGQCHKLNFNRERCVIVCGVPEPIKNKHAFFLAKIAMRIMGKLSEFRFRHVDDNRIRFQIAIHSGIFVSGITGLKLPVFNAMGKEVDIAEGLADATPTLRILVSEQCKRFLDNAKGCTLENEKIPFLVKGHGVINGYFLKTVKGVRVKLRNPNLRATASATAPSITTVSTVTENIGKLKSALKK